MYVCICNDVKDKQIKKAISAGHVSMDALREHLDVASCCGCCEPMVQDYLDEHHQSNARVNRLAMAI